MFSTAKKVHFVGIGGSGMSGIAEVLLSLGFPVSGSDSKRTPVTERLADLGAHIQYQHASGNVTGADVLVVSSAISKKNPEIIEAQNKRTPIIHRSEMLAELMRLKHGILVAGTHGKTTTTSMLASALFRAGLDPTCIIGGKLYAIGSSAQVGKGEFFIAEADESDGSFLKLTPTIAVVTNVDRDHMDHYPNFESICDAFRAFLEKVPFYGAVCACVDDGGVRRVLAQLQKRVVSYGLGTDADVTALRVSSKDFSMRFVPRVFGKELDEVHLKMPGRYNVSNALASFAVGHVLGVDLSQIVTALNDFQGVQHRFSVLGKEKGCVVVDDYAHNPKKIQAVLSGLREARPQAKICAVFQPHRYTRLQALWDEFQVSFVHADWVIVTAVYAASESPIDGVTSEGIANAIAQHSFRGDKNRVKIAVTLEDAASFAHTIMCGEAGDDGVVITLGAGDVQKVGPRVLELLK